MKDDQDLITPDISGEGKEEIGPITKEITPPPSVTKPKTPQAISVTPSSATKPKTPTPPLSATKSKTPTPPPKSRTPAIALKSPTPILTREQIMHNIAKTPTPRERVINESPPSRTRTAPITPTERKTFKPYSPLHPEETPREKKTFDKPGEFNYLERYRFLDSLPQDEQEAIFEYYYTKTESIRITYPDAGMKRAGRDELLSVVAHRYDVWSRFLKAGANLNMIKFFMYIYLAFIEILFTMVLKVEAAKGFFDFQQQLMSQYDDVLFELGENSNTGFMDDWPPLVKIGAYSIFFLVIFMVGQVIMAKMGLDFNSAVKMMKTTVGGTGIKISDIVKGFQEGNVMKVVGNLAGAFNGGQNNDSGNYAPPHSE